MQHVSSRRRALAPSDPRVLNALGLQALRANDAASARPLLEQAVAGEPREPVLWLNLAQCRRMQADTGGELIALDQALALQPRFYPCPAAKGDVARAPGETETGGPSL